MRAAFLGVLFLGLGCGPARGESRPERPNIVVLLAGDMGFSDLGCYGGEIETPHLDRLAAEGVRFTQFYNTARCCPTRASLLTGLYPRRAGVGHRVEDRGRPGYQGFLNDRCVTVPEVLRAAGYRTMMTGKWHVGGERPHWPVDRGFDRYFGVIDGGSNYFKLDRGRTMARDGGRVSPPARADFYMTDAFTDAALEFLDEARGGRGSRSSLRRMPPPPPGASPPHPGGLSEPGALGDVLKAAGLRVVEEGEVACPFIFPSTEATWRGNASAGVNQGAIARSGEAAVRAFDAEADRAHMRPDGSIRYNNVGRRRATVVGVGCLSDVGMPQMGSLVRPCLQQAAARLGPGDGRGA
jgi:hypothetical protein